jgi:hypothetical protein
MTFQIEGGIAANAYNDGSISIYHEQNIIFMKQEVAEKFKIWINEVLP